MKVDRVAEITALLMRRGYSAEAAAIAAAEPPSISFTGREIAVRWARPVSTTRRMAAIIENVQRRVIEHHEDHAYIAFARAEPQRLCRAMGTAGSAPNCPTCGWNGLWLWCGVSWRCEACFGERR